MRTDPGLKGLIPLLGVLLTLNVTASSVHAEDASGIPLLWKASQERITGIHAEYDRYVINKFPPGFEDAPDDMNVWADRVLEVCDRIDARCENIPTLYDDEDWGILADVAHITLDLLPPRIRRIRTLLYATTRFGDGEIGYIPPRDIQWFDGNLFVRAEENPLRTPPIGKNETPQKISDIVIWPAGKGPTPDGPAKFHDGLLRYAFPTVIYHPGSSPRLSGPEAVDDGVAVSALAKDGTIIWRVVVRPDDDYVLAREEIRRIDDEGNTTLSRRIVLDYLEPDEKLPPYPQILVESGSPEQAIVYRFRHVELNPEFPARIFSVGDVPGFQITGAKTEDHRTDTTYGWGDPVE